MMDQMFKNKLDHSYRNTQCACRSCNASKGSQVYGQIPMFAT